MANWRNVFAFMALLPGVGLAADPAMLELIMPDARFVMDINVARLIASPVGQTISAEVKAELQGLRPDMLQPTQGATVADWTRYAQEMIVAGGPGGSSLTIVRGLLDPAWIESLRALHGTKTAYLGFPVLATGNGNTIVAFVEGSISVIGPAPDVKAALRRRGQDTSPSPVLAEGLEKYDGQYDVWVVSSGAPTALAKTPSGTSMPWLQRMDAFKGGMRLSPDFELSADMTMRTEKDVADMVEGLRWFAGVVQTQAQGAGNLDNMTYAVDGRRLTFGLEVPERQVRAALAERGVGQRARWSPAAPRPEITSGMPDPPAGSIRVQSSPGDMGTALVPVGKSQ